ncbi:hypothetical protein V2J09_011793 [Rumex salicifolius]
MASKSNPKRLSELLEEQQEPFRLEVYLYERGCKITSLDFKGSFFGLHGRRKVKAWVLKVLPFKLKDWSFSEKVEESRTEFNSFSESDVENIVINGSQIQRQSSLQNDDKATEECIFSATLWELFIHKKEVVGQSESRFSRHMNSMKAMQQTRQLLFDCVREAVESSHGRQKKAKDFGKIIKIWDKQSIDGMKIDKLIKSEILSSYQEDDIFEDFREEIVKEVGDKILDEMADEIILSWKNSLKTTTAASDETETAEEAD